MNQQTNTPEQSFPFNFEEVIDGHKESIAESLENNLSLGLYIDEMIRLSKNIKVIAEQECDHGAIEIISISIKYLENKENNIICRVTQFGESFHDLLSNIILKDAKIKGDLKTLIWRFLSAAEEIQDNRLTSIAIEIGSRFGV